MSRNERAAVIRQLEKSRNSRVIAYFCSDRQCAAAQIGEDAVRPMYDVLRVIGRTERIDLFLFSHGGALEVPWRIVAMLREYCDHLGVLIPYFAQSAATLIALGCDQLVLGSKAELGPIDPAKSVVTREGSTATREDVRVEDVMAYIEFLTKKANIDDPKTIGQHTHSLAERLRPWTLGSLYRTHSHIRMVAERMLASHKNPHDCEQIAKIIQALAEETRSHGHGISRKEAELLGLKIQRPDRELEDAMWQLFEHYEAACSMRDPIDPETSIGSAPQKALRVILAWIESTEMTWGFRGDLHLRRIRPPSPRFDVKVNLGFSLNFTPPPGVDLQNLPTQALAQIQQDLSRQIQSQLQQHVQALPEIVREHAEAQMLPGDVTIRVVAKWTDVTHEGV